MMLDLSVDTFFFFFFCFLLLLLLESAVSLETWHHFVIEVAA